MNDYYFDSDGKFIIEDYNNKKPFSSFLPGIAGQLGIPMWTFYSNRAQGITGFGINNKNSPIMEFNPAGISYHSVHYKGFRTFFKIRKNGKEIFYEPFISDLECNNDQKMKISNNCLEIEEISNEHGIKINVSYFCIPNEDFAGLVRKVKIQNIGETDSHFELLDGLPAVIPYGAKESDLKTVSYTLQSWMSAIILDNKVSFYKTVQMPGDEPIVEGVASGNFYLTILEKNGHTSFLKPIVDSRLIFGLNTSLNKPDNFLKTDIENINKSKQITKNKIPCGFFGTDLKLEHQEQVEINSVIGFANNFDWLRAQLPIIGNKNFIEFKETENNEIINNIIENIYTKTSSETFDSYCNQTYLDNVLRGGYPIIFENNCQKLDKSVVFHSYTRKHGDMERDYNFFALEPLYYSQGNGNYRDVNQNRRCDVYINPKVQYSNILTFMNLIQADGYNPLEIRGSQFLMNKNESKKILQYTNKKELLEKFLINSFSPGTLVKFIKINDIKLSISIHDFLTQCLLNSTQFTDAEFKEGYWIDHWTYNLDLIETYIDIYPEMIEELFFHIEEFTYFDNPVIILPRHNKTVLLKGEVRQIDSIKIDKNKQQIIDSREKNNNLVRIKNVNGPIFKTSLITKLINLVTVKFASLDPFGMGIEMEANKPGWNDALNGLPSVFGSSMSETYELSRYIYFTLELEKDYSGFNFLLPKEVNSLLMSIYLHLQDFYNSNRKNKDFMYWDEVSREKEQYREKIQYCFSGELVKTNLTKIKHILLLFQTKIQNGISLSLELSKNKIASYFYYEVLEYETMYTNEGRIKKVSNGLINVKVTKFKPHPLPLFLEGFVKALKLEKLPKRKKDLWSQVRNSDLYDNKLKMYKLNESLTNQPEFIGRAKAFTPGWLENESIWIHMEYKYLLQILKSGLYNEFLEDFKNVLIPFQNPSIYGRSPAENSSFIVSSAFPDEILLGTGYYARLSGSTAEFLEIWFLMMVGKNPFTINNDLLNLKFNPVLPGWLFDKKGNISFNFLGKTLVTYHNPERINIIRGYPSIREIIIESGKNESEIISGGLIPEPYSRDIRSGKIKDIKIYFEN